MMEYLTPQQILFIHHRLIETTGGSHGVRDLAALQAAAARPQATFEGNDLYPAIHDKAAAVLESLIRSHPFIDGNKRTAITASGLFLRRNGRILSAEQETLYIFTIRMATGEADFAEAREWLLQHTRDGV
ncbi:type II toxin-antitoxin system death-on-curing family toxin [Geoalkalibacter halelectricus]|uniref:type II toxin-antitoxin system death-on-curing family toxin n=1 Tax=Geoalkalibacter halelectricus TaxID=2847045 RepID=UPI003D1B6A19